MSGPGFAERIQRRWQAPPPWWLRLPARLFGVLATLRRAAYRRGWLRSEQLPVPVLVVGNISVGGTGKTPLTIALAQALTARGFRPGVVSRGYGRDGSTTRRVQPGDPPGLVGDEPRLIADAAGVPVAVSPRRAEAGRHLLATDPCDLLIADDGLQHYALARDLEIAVVDGRRRLGNRWLLPAGPLREPPSRLRRVDFVVVNGGESAVGEVPMRLEPGDAEPLAGGPPVALAAFRGQAVHAVAGIGDPSRFFDALAAFGIEVIAHPFPDHHRFVAADFAFADARPVLMTAKDAVKCEGFAGADWYRVPVRASLPDAFYDAVAARLRALDGVASR